MSARILVTGVNGQVGGAIMAVKDYYPFEFIPISRAEWDMAKEPEKAAELIEQHQPDIVINPAAYTNVDGAEDNKEAAFSVNATAVCDLAKACQQADIPLLHVSTDYVFDGTKEMPYTEVDPINPINVYGKSKAEGERLVREVLNAHIILRTSWVFSAAGKNFVTTMRRLGKERDELKIVNDQRSGPTSADCIANVLMSIVSQYLQGREIPWGTYHYAGLPIVSWYEFAEAIFEAEDEAHRPKLTPCASTEYLTNVVRPPNSILSSARLTDYLKIDPCEWKVKLQIIQAQETGEE
ncbi:dTDP-4-dehydrorhamnose reductase [Litorivicinus sp.]|nr:dTDP-4-dehydrorhamnose reductase [Litorivicinus sp.]